MKSTDAKKRLLQVSLYISTLLTRHPSPNVSGPAAVQQQEHRSATCDSEIISADGVLVYCDVRLVSHSRGIVEVSERFIWGWNKLVALCLSEGDAATRLCNVRKCTAH
jgi:hypothetical protein